MKSNTSLAFLAVAVLRLGRILSLAVCAPKSAPSGIYTTRKVATLITSWAVNAILEGIARSKTMFVTSFATSR
jgi:hypothetical protein